MGVPDRDHLDKTDLNKMFRYQQRLREDLRKQFRSEYLSQLVQRLGRGGRHQDVQVGDVLIESEGKERTFWSMARVMEAYPGRDGYLRVARLKTATVPYKFSQKYIAHTTNGNHGNEVCLT